MQLSEHCEICGAFAWCYSIEYNQLFRKGTLDVCEKCLKKLDKHDENSKIDNMVCCRPHKSSKFVP